MIRAPASLQHTSDPPWQLASFETPAAQAASTLFIILACSHPSSQRTLSGPSLPAADCASLIGLSRSSLRSRAFGSFSLCSFGFVLGSSALSAFFPALFLPSFTCLFCPLHPQGAEGPPIQKRTLRLAPTEKQQKLPRELLLWIHGLNGFPSSWSMLKYSALVPCRQNP